MSNVYREFAALTYHCTWSFSEAYNLPVQLREFFFGELVKAKKAEAEAAKGKSEDKGPPPRPQQAQPPQRDVKKIRIPKP